MSKVEVIEISRPKNIFYYFVGLLILALNKLRYSTLGYRTPRVFDTSEYHRAIKYDIDVVDQWVEELKKYAIDETLIGKNVLELGPGGDLGIGLIMLSKGAKTYNSMDINNLVKDVPEEFYHTLFDHLNKHGSDEDAMHTLKEQLRLTRQESNDRLNYLVREDFDITVFGKSSVDLVFSQAAFEHFDDIHKTFSQLSEVVREGGKLVTEIDLNTHTRWIRDVDPLNIYRYSEGIYKFFKFSGSPNRLRPYEYVSVLEKYGWINVKVQPLVKVSEPYLDGIKGHLPKRFDNDSAQMGYLSVLVTATKG